MTHDEAIEAARAFHDAYERLAAETGYVTRPDTRDFDPETLNGRLMIATTRAVAPILMEHGARLMQAAGMRLLSGTDEAGWLLALDPAAIVKEAK
jgi:hypothetical protein